MLRTGLVIVALTLLAYGAALADGFILPGPPDHILFDEPNFTVKYHHVECEIRDQVATTYVDQVFINNSHRELEATYVFPLPAGAVVNSFTLWADGKAMEAKLLTKDEAVRIYENIVRQRRDPALLTYAGNNFYQARIFPVPAGGERKIELRYSQICPFDNGLISYLYPMSTEKFSRDPIKQVVFTADIYSQDTIGTVYSPSHDISVSKLSEGHVRVSYEETNAKPDRDLLLYYNVALGPLSANVITFKETDRDGFFLLLAAPTVEADPAQAPPKDICFVLDTSGSMSGDKIEQAKKALTFCVNSLNHQDRFNIISFSDTQEEFRHERVPASADNVAEARQFIDRMQARGGTDIDTALRLALDTDADNAGFYVVFLTDGQPTVGEQDEGKIVQNVSDEVAKLHGLKTRLFAFGVGYDVNTNLLDKLAQGNGGLTTYVREQENLEVKVSSFYSKIAQPALMNPRLDFGGVDVYDTFPRELPDLFHGSQLVVLGRYKGGSPDASHLTLSGGIAGGTRRFGFNADFPQRQTGTEYIAALWAARKIGYLLDEIRLHGEKQELVDEVVRLSREYGILTQYTAFLAEEPSAMSAHEAAGQAFDSVAAASAPGGPMGGMGAGGMSGAQNAQAMQLQSKVGFNRYLDAEGNMQSISNVQQVGQRGFANRQGRWEDLRYSPDMPITVQVQAYSEAYFQLSRAFPELNSQLALGDNLIVVVNNHAVQIGAEGDTHLTDAQLHALGS